MLWEVYLIALNQSKCLTFKKRKKENLRDLDLVVYLCNHSTLDTEAGGIPEFKANLLYKERLCLSEKQDKPS